MADNDWVTAAMTDDMLVVQLLIRMKHDKAASIHKSLPVITFKWGIRRLRSRMATRCGGVEKKKEIDSSTRFSPTTPLSWNGGGRDSSPSDGFEETSISNRSTSASRSKVVCSSDATSIILKRSGKRKIFDDLKDEGGFVFNEKVSLKKELGTVGSMYTNQRSTNDNFKRMKVDFGFVQPANNATWTHKSQEKDSYQKNSIDASCKSRICSADLNMMPFDLNMMPFDQDDANLYETS